MKILISPGFGAGWSTWSNGERAKFGRTYQPIIDWLESHPGTQFEGPEADALLEQFHRDVTEKFPGDDYFYIGGANDLTVVDVEPPFQIHEYDGHESIITPSDSNDWVTE